MFCDLGNVSRSRTTATTDNIDAIFSFVVTHVLAHFFWSEWVNGFTINRNRLTSVWNHRNGKFTHLCESRDDFLHQLRTERTVDTKDVDTNATNRSIGGFHVSIKDLHLVELIHRHLCHDRYFETEFFGSLVSTCN